MTRFTTFAAAVAMTALAVSTPVFAQSVQDSNRFRAAQSRLSNELSIFQQEFDRYQASIRNGGPGPRGGPQGYNDPRGGGYADDERVETGYEPSRYYRDGSQYQERVLSPDDRVYRGNDGRYYCKRNDGTTGLILGAAGGGVLGNVIDGGRSRTVGTLIGAALGGLAGRAVDQNNQQVKCR